MATFAKLNNDNIVIEVVRIDDSVMLTKKGVESETLGKAYLNKYFGKAKWVQTSYNNNKRGKFAGKGDYYDSENDVFYYPHKPFPSWVLNENFIWVAPVDPPDIKAHEWDDNDDETKKELTKYRQIEWNEETLSWDVTEKDSEFDE